VSPGFFEQPVVGSAQMVASCGFGGGKVEGVEAGDAEDFDFLRSASQGFR
jgi:hypothetical protein